MENDPRKREMFRIPVPASRITGIGGCSEEARCYGVGRFSERERHCTSRWREETQADQEKRGEGIGGELMERERGVAGHEDVWMRREAGREMTKTIK